MEQISGTILDPVNRRQFPGTVTITDGTITSIKEDPEVEAERYIMPGFVDAHIHIESSMLVPSEFARLAVRHGTVATVSDPHEIANVCGIDGVEYMIENGKKVPLKFHFGAPSCVPATPFETAGAELDAEAVARLLDREEIYYLAEMMNWPGVLQRDAGVMAKIEAAQQRGKPVDGHAPGLKGDKAEQYASAGISTDHECFTIDEARDKLSAGMKILIREGSAAKNYEALIPLLGEAPDRIMFCSDDKHPDDLVEGHINQLARESIARGYDLMDVLHACCVAPVKHYKLHVGLLQLGDPADLIVVDHPETMNVLETWIDGQPAYRNQAVCFDPVDAELINNFEPYRLSADSFRVPVDTEDITVRYPVIIAEDGQLITDREDLELSVEDGVVAADPERDILKIAVVNRYKESEPAVGFIRNFGLKRGAIASSVAHDSHNIVAVGCSDEVLQQAVNLIMEQRGGISAVDGNTQEMLPLPVAGIMTDRPGSEVAEQYQKLNEMAIAMGSELHAPFMLISFMALLVIPSLKMSDKGLFDGEQFSFVTV